MKRKVFRNGPSLVVTLPSKWVEECGVNVGDELKVDISNNQLILSCNLGNSKKEVSLDAKGLDRTFLQAYIRSAYRKGYDVINIHIPSIDVLHHRIGKKLSTNFVVNQEVNNLIGTEITEESDTHFTIKKISIDTKDDFDVLLRRIFLTIIQHYEELFQALTGQKSWTEDVFIQKYRNIKKSMSYLLRLVNKLGSANPKNNAIMYHLISSLDLVNDLVKDSVRDVFEHSISASAHAIEILQEINEICTAYYHLYYDYSHQKVVDLSWKRRDILNEIKKNLAKLSPEEIVIIHRLEQTIEILYLLSVDIMALQHD